MSKPIEARDTPLNAGDKHEPEKFSGSEKIRRTLVEAYASRLTVPDRKSLAAAAQTAADIEEKHWEAVIRQATGTGLEATQKLKAGWVLQDIAGFSKAVAECGELPAQHCDNRRLQTFIWNTAALATYEQTPMRQTHLAGILEKRGISDGLVITVDRITESRSGLIKPENEVERLYSAVEWGVGSHEAEGAWGEARAHLTEVLGRDWFTNNAYAGEQWKGALWGWLKKKQEKGDLFGGRIPVSDGTEISVLAVAPSMPDNDIPDGELRV